MFAVYIKVERDFGMTDYDAIVSFDKALDAHKYIRWLKTQPDYVDHGDILTFSVGQYLPLKHNLEPGEAP